MSEKIKILHIEDSMYDAEIIHGALKNDEIEFDLKHVRNKTEFVEAMQDANYDLVLCDYTLPGFSGSDALDIVMEKNPEIPFIFVSGTIGEERAVEALKRGAVDYVIKGNLNRLTSSIKRAIRESKERKERKLAELQLKESQHFVENIIETSPNVIYLYNVETNEAIYTNKRLETILGYSQQEIDNIKSRFFHYLLDQSVIENAFGHFSHFDSMNDGDVLEYEYKMRHKDGSWKWLRANEAVFLRDDNGKIRVIVGVAQDITEKKESEKRQEVEYEVNKILAESDHFNEASTEILKLISITFGWDLSEIWLYNEQEKIFQWYNNYCNSTPAIQEFANKSLKLKFPANETISYQLLNTNKPLFFPVLKESSILFRKEDALNAGLSAVMIFPIISGNKVTGAITFMNRKKFEMSEALVKTLQSICNPIGVFIKRKKFEEELIKSEERFKLIANAANDAIWDYDADNDKLWWSSGMAKLFGYEDMQEISTINKFAEKIVLEDRHNFVEGIRKSIEQKNNYWSGELRLYKFDGSIADIYDRMYIIYDEKGLARRMVGSLTDITDRKSFEREIIKAKEKAEESDKLKSEFLAQMSHEIRTPLNVILSYASIIFEEFGVDAQDDFKDIFSGINSAGRRLIRTIDLILNMSAIQTGNYEVDFVEIKLHNVLRNIVNEFESLSSSKNLKLEFKDEIPDIKIIGDEYTVTQIFQNLIDNALKYTKKGSVTIKLYKNAEDKVAVDVTDTGIGIAPEYIPHIYKPFTQESTGYSRKFEGSGLGLALTNKYIEINHAKLEVKSEKDKGSTFTVIF
jgi:PAS domain S-box-containing protein